MARKSFRSQQKFLAGTMLKPKLPSRDLRLADQLIETRLRIEQAKLAQIEADIPPNNPKHTRYVDMPLPTLEDEAEFEAEFQQVLKEIFDARELGPQAGQTVQDWLAEQGAVIPDIPDWNTPLYLEKF